MNKTVNNRTLPDKGFQIIMLSPTKRGNAGFPFELLLFFFITTSQAHQTGIKHLGPNCGITLQCTSTDIKRTAVTKKKNKNQNIFSCNAKHEIMN